MNCSIPHIRRIESLQVVPMPNHQITGLTNSIFSICTCAFGGCRDDSQSALGRMEKWRERKEALPEIERVKRHLIVEFRMLFVPHACFALRGCSAGVALLLCSPYSLLLASKVALLVLLLYFIPSPHKRRCLAHLPEWRIPHQALSPVFGFVETATTFPQALANEDKAWFEREAAANEKALRRTRALLPVDVTGLTVAELEQRAIEAGSLYPRELAMRLKVHQQG